MSNWQDCTDIDRIIFEKAYVAYFDEKKFTF